MGFLHSCDNLPAHPRLLLHSQSPCLTLSAGITKVCHHACLPLVFLTVCSAVDNCFLILQRRKRSWLHLQTHSKMPSSFPSQVVPNHFTLPWPLGKARRALFCETDARSISRTIQMSRSLWGLQVQKVFPVPPSVQTSSCCKLSDRSPAAAQVSDLGPCSLTR